ncbi:hypothetical protein A1O3_04940 [Capronia epimyces CBS 606.96]|uniref:Zn(2)-C6 fungal-type domain-containing protein n=1 Tax=Capronia epimyces CBS 606.96 TaxID=1182542 RepID=W9XVL0_9EURO|nr:uncharacterized protein A1O3_04940 [Capronia epimyces CBS 606.96]EXJ84273.1 hypothetical protein A1O3_04940 [Capronia epimyces CBS 606.96]
MPTRAESNACSACARSKRKCGRQIPSCARCVDRATACVYPPSRSRAASSARPLLSDAWRGRGLSRGTAPRLDSERLLAEVQLEVAGNTNTSSSSRPATLNLSHADDLSLADDLMLDTDLAFPLLDSDCGFTAPSSLIQPPAPTPNPGTQATTADWFLAPETWEISYRAGTSADVPVGIATMKKYVAVLQSWFERWVATGSNPFIHACLYSANSPACVQVAYATLASYIHRTPANTDTILQIVEDRSNDLLRENGAILARVDAEEWADPDAGEQDVHLDLFTQLTRLHALMVYQIIGLFDGDIRSRHVAQGHMAVLDSWAGRLFRSAAKTLSNTQTHTHAHAHAHAHALATHAHPHLVGWLPTLSTATSTSTYSQQQCQWYLWILAESIRRTWLVAVSLCPVYSTLQQRWATCPGGVMYTNRSGLWNAATATEWEKQCLRWDVAFLQRFESATVLDHSDPADIDEFGTAMLDMTFNRDLLEKWRNRGPA